jgi:hypothetical protein
MSPARDAIVPFLRKARAPHCEPCIATKLGLQLNEVTLTVLSLVKEVRALEQHKRGCSICGGQPAYVAVSSPSA